MARAAAKQVPMNYSRRGGARLGAGRRKKKDAGVSHRERPELAANQPVHVTLRVREDVYNLRSQRCFEAIREAVEASRGHPGFRSVGLSVQGNHIHLLGEAASTAALTLGIQGLKVRIAKGLNRVMGRHGKVFAERYHLRVLKTPADARATMAYVANNTAKHAAQVGKHLPADFQDPYTVGHFGDRVLLPPGTEGMVVEPTSWLLREGWRKRKGAAGKGAAGKGDVGKGGVGKGGVGKGGVGTGGAKQGDGLVESPTVAAAAPRGWFPRPARLSVTVPSRRAGSDSTESNFDALEPREPPVAMPLFGPEASEHARTPEVGGPLEPASTGHSYAA